MTEGEIVFTRDKSSGRVHKRVRVGAGFATLEGDNLDEAGAYEIIATLADTDLADICDRCFSREEKAAVPDGLVDGWP